IMGYRSNHRAIGDAWTREWAAQRPVVYPVPLDEWLSGHGGAYQASSNSRLFPLKNGGRGPALNVVGVLTVTSGNNTTEHQILASTIAAGDLFNARLAPPSSWPTDWAKACGAITYGDLAAGSYKQGFTFTKGPSGELELMLDEPTQSPGSAAHSLGVSESP